MTFGLREAVSHILATTSLTSPHDVASKVAETVPPDELVAVLTEAMEPYVREIMQFERMNNPVIRPAQRRHSRADNARDWWDKALRDRVHVGHGQYKTLGDCLHDDLLYAAQERHKKAEQNIAVARRFEYLAALLDEYKVARVADLPPEAVK